MTLSTLRCLTEGYARHSPLIDVRTFPPWHFPYRKFLGITHNYSGEYPIGLPQCGKYPKETSGGKCTPYRACQAAITVGGLLAVTGENERGENERQSENDSEMKTISYMGLYVQVPEYRQELVQSCKQTGKDWSKRKVLSLEWNWCQETASRGVESVEPSQWGDEVCIA